MLKEKSKVIFLDIDGVLQPYSNDSRFRHDLFGTLEMLAKNYKDKVYLSMDRYDVGAAYYDWDIEATRLLKKCFDDTGAIAVISSAWKDFLSLKQLKAIFRFYHLDGYIKDSLPDGVDKEKLIKSYLKRNKENILGYVVVDDMRMDFAKGSHMVLTFNKLTEEDVEEIKKALKLSASVE